MNNPTKPDRLPTMDEIRTWLTAHDWHPRNPGLAGALWSPKNDDGISVAVLNTCDDPVMIIGVVDRLASYSGQKHPERLVTEMIAAASKGSHA